MNQDSKLQSAPPSSMLTSMTSPYQNSTASGGGTIMSSPYQNSTATGPGSLMSSPYQNSTTTGTGGPPPSFMTPTATSQNLVIPAAPSKSAEQQWLETVVKPSNNSQSQSQPQPSNFSQQGQSRVGRSSFLETMKSHKSQWSHMKAKSAMNSSVNFTTREFEDPYHPHPHPMEQGTQLPLDDHHVQPYITTTQHQGQTEAQLEAQRRMELMQREIDEVIGVMRMNFNDPCVVSPDRRLSELYHHCPEYDSKKWRCGGKEKEDEEAKRKKWREFWKQLCMLFWLFILIALLIAGDYWASSWFIGNESEKLLEESRIRVAKRGNQTAGEGGGDGSGDGGIGRSLEGGDGGGSGGEGGGGGEVEGNVEETTVTVITQIEEEDIKATLDEGEGDAADGITNMTEEEDPSLRRGHDVLEEAQVQEVEPPAEQEQLAQEEDSGPGLVASNPDKYYQQRQMLQ